MRGPKKREFMGCRAQTIFITYAEEGSLTPRPAAPPSRLSSTPIVNETDINRVNPVNSNEFTPSATDCG